MPIDLVGVVLEALERPPAEDLALFASAQRGMEEALEPLRPYLEGIDPSLGKTWAQTLGNADRGLERLRDRAFKARLGQLGFSKGELRRLQTLRLHRNRLKTLPETLTDLSLKELTLVHNRLSAQTKRWVNRHFSKILIE